ncbi:MAG: hypothetical protein R3277_10225 [Brumimicrobium sp.]|nr:hypothetical protein [Brumimicrobium sp.]
MKKIICFTSLVVLLFSSCGTSKDKKETVETDSGGSEMNMDSNYIIGQVMLNFEGCEITIISENDPDMKLYPVSLDEMFRVDKAYLQFEFDPSRAPLPEGCEGTRAVVLRNVTRVKR